eukprot:GHVQ01010519.1.p1 GENE.GHVQ01010519.1~~GHVQ01010519.1.p1  ORF type:complete len:106 (+),score=15.56 GHVQ01010519.1:294-611(+)
MTMCVYVYVCMCMCLSVYDNIAESDVRRYITSMKSGSAACTVFTSVASWNGGCVLMGVSEAASMNLVWCRVLVGFIACWTQTNPSVSGVGLCVLGVPCDGASLWC